MGCEFSSITSSERNEEFRHPRSVYRLLLLGPGESGKSTFIKQMVNRFQHGYPIEERKKFRMCVVENTLECVKTILRWSDRLYELEVEGTRTDPAKDDAKRALLETPATRQLSKETAELVKLFWRSDKGFMCTFENSWRYQLLDCAEYFLDRIDFIAEEGYVPSKEDVFHSRTVTTGVVDIEFRLEKSIFKIIDVGGQRSQRKKWIHCFSGVTAVIFFAAINEYDQALFEEKSQNRMDESINLFEDISNSTWFSESIIVLFFNKKDLFEKKIGSTPITTFFKDYCGDPKSVSESINHIRKVFLNSSQHPEEIYTHVTTATDSKNIDVVFNAVKDTILKTNLKRGGFI